MSCSPKADEKGATGALSDLPSAWSAVALAPVRRRTPRGSACRTFITKATALSSRRPHLKAPRPQHHRALTAILQRVAKHRARRHALHGVADASVVGALSPALLLAVTLKKYCVPGVKPGTKAEMNLKRVAVAVIDLTLAAVRLVIVDVE